MEFPKVMDEPEIWGAIYVCRAHVRGGRAGGAGHAVGRWSCITIGVGREGLEFNTKRHNQLQSQSCLMAPVL